MKTPNIMKTLNLTLAVLGILATSTMSGCVSFGDDDDDDRTTTTRTTRSSGMIAPSSTTVERTTVIDD